MESDSKGLHTCGQCRDSMKMSSCGLDKNVPFRRHWGTVADAGRKLTDESKRTETASGAGAGQERRTQAGHGGGGDGRDLSPGQAGVAAVSSGGRCRVSASVARTAQSPAQAGRVTAAGAGALHAAVSGFWADAGSGVSGGRGSGGGSRDAAAVVDRPGDAECAAAGAAASGLARTPSLLWDDGATGRVASRLV